MIRIREYKGKAVNTGETIQGFVCQEMYSDKYYIGKYVYSWIQVDPNTIVIAEEETIIEQDEK